MGQGGSNRRFHVLVDLKRELEVVACLGFAAVLSSGCVRQEAHNPALPMNPAQFFVSTVQFLLIGILIWYMLVWRPATLKREGQEKFVEGLKKNDEVMTSDGIFARVHAVKAEYVTVEIAPNIRVRVARDHLRPVSAPSEQPRAETPGKEDKTKK